MGLSLTLMLGDSIEQALTKVGITKDRVERVVGPCCCEERKKRLNDLHAWAKRVLAGKVERAKEYLEKICGQ